MPSPTSEARLLTNLTLNSPKAADTELERYYAFQDETESNTTALPPSPTNAAPSSFHYMLPPFPPIRKPTTRPLLHKPAPPKPDPKSRARDYPVSETNTGLEGECVVCGTIPISKPIRRYLETAACACVTCSFCLERLVPKDTANIVWKVCERCGIPRAEPEGVAPDVAGVPGVKGSVMVEQRGGAEEKIEDKIAEKVEGKVEMKVGATAQNLGGEPITRKAAAGALDGLDMSVFETKDS